MVELFIDWNDFSTSSGKRILEGDMRQTIILVTGPSMCGKSTLADQLTNSDIKYFNMDQLIEILLPMCMGGQELLDSCIEEDWINYGWVSHELANSLLGTDYIEKFFYDIVVKLTSSVILLDGYIFTFENLRNFFIQLCLQKPFHVWELRRHL